MAEETREEREARWWRDWFAADYSWDGLAEKDILGGGQFGEVTLQDYWRRDPATGKVRTDAALKKAGELIEFDGRWWHLAHLPPRGRNGGESWKADLTAGQWMELNPLISERVDVVVETPGTFELGDGTRHWRPQAADGRALWRGAVLGSCQISPGGRARAWFLSCRQAAFLGDVSFDGGVFGPGADFATAIFMGNVSFDDVTFSADVDFDAATFSALATFFRTTFSAAAYFGHAAFSADAHFFHTIFSAQAGFDIAIFSAAANFDSARFSANASFFGVTFLDRAHFDNTIFSAGAWFDSSTFLGVASFFFATFSGGASFGKIIFSGNAWFDNITVLGVADFGTSIFSDSASFTRATFKSAALFYGVFEASADFHNTVFEGPVTFSAAIAEPERNFAGAFYAARFGAIANFSGAVAEDQGGRLAAAFVETQFEKALILTDGPDLLARRHFREHMLPGAEVGGDDGFRQLEAGCRTVKIAMGKARDELREQRYYRFQLGARLRRGDIDGWERSIGGIYRLVSDFGSSLWRPLAALLMFTILCGQAYAVWGASVTGARFTPVVSRDYVFEGQGLALSALKPFSTIEAPKPREVSAKDAASKGDVQLQPAPPSLVSVLTRDAAITLGLRVATALQVVVSGVLIFLFGLAVKRRFQIS